MVMNYSTHPRDRKRPPRPSQPFPKTSAEISLASQPAHFLKTAKEMACLPANFLQPCGVASGACAAAARAAARPARRARHAGNRNAFCQHRPRYEAALCCASPGLPSPSASHVHEDWTGLTSGHSWTDQWTVQTQPAQNKHTLQPWKHSLQRGQTPKWG